MITSINFLQNLISGKCPPPAIYSVPIESNDDKLG
jgi:hypothetical protein